MKNLLLVSTYVVFLCILPIIINGECTCDAEESNEGTKTLALNFKLGAIGSILLFSAIGVCIPVLSKVFPAFQPFQPGTDFTISIKKSGCIAQAKFKSRAVVVMGLFFALTTPVGITIGIGISNVYKENSPTALIVEGVLNSASAGILVYMALVDLLAADFMSAKIQDSLKLLVEVCAFLLLGAGLMSMLAIWA